MNTKQLLGLIGSIVLFIGVFTPIVSVPIMGNMNYFQNGQVDGTIVLIFAVISLVLVLAKKFKGFWFTGIGGSWADAFHLHQLPIKNVTSKSRYRVRACGQPFVCSSRYSNANQSNFNGGGHCS